MFVIQLCGTKWFTNVGTVLCVDPETNWYILQGYFVATFASSNLGDVSPNVKGARCQFSGRPCDAHTSTCSGPREMCIASGPGVDMFDSTRIVAERLYDKAWVCWVTWHKYTGKWVSESQRAVANSSRVQLKCEGTGLRTGGEVKGKLANAAVSQYSSNYLGTWCIQHYCRWCAHLGCQQSTDLAPPADLNGLVRFAERRILVSARVPSHYNWSVGHATFPPAPDTGTARCNADCSLAVSVSRSLSPRRSCALVSCSNWMDIHEIWYERFVERCQSTDLLIFYFRFPDRCIDITLKYIRAI
jgi:hypothetical protein